MIILTTNMEDEQMREVTCQWCKGKSPKDQMAVQVTGKKRKINKYYHQDKCYNEFLEDKEFKRLEAERKDNLVQEIQRIYAVKALPSTVFPLLEALRNGNRIFGKQNMTKRYKQGYEYELIQETFAYCEDRIDYSVKVKNFNDITGAIKYGLSIVINHIHTVEKMIETRNAHAELAKEKAKAMRDSQTYIEDDAVFKTSFKRADAETLSDFLDDED